MKRNRRTIYSFLAGLLATSSACYGGERFEIQDVQASSARLVGCLTGASEWKPEISSRQIIDFRTVFRNPALPNVCLQYVTCSHEKKREQISQILECELTPSGQCEDPRVCAAKRAETPREFYLADIKGKAGATHYSGADSTACYQAGNPEALYAAPDRAVCLHKMDCGKPDAPKTRYVVACQVTGQAFRSDRLEDGSVQECPPLIECVQTQLRNQTFPAFVEQKQPETKPVAEAPQTKTAPTTTTQKSAKQSPTKSKTTRTPATKALPKKTTSKHSKKNHK